MKFICTQANIAKGLAQVVPVAGRNVQLPILSHVLCEAKEGVLHLTATDLENGIHTTVAGKVEREGSTTIPARKVFEYIQQVPGSHPLTLERTDTRLTITTEGFKAQFPVNESDEFPLLPTTKESAGVTLPASQVCTALQGTAFAAAREETRPEIHSVYMVVTAREVRVAATDSFRLAEAIIPLEAGESEHEFSVLLPLSTAQEIVRLFSEEKEITLYPHENQLIVNGADTELTSRLGVGQYPDYQQIIPTQFKVDGVVDTDALRRALKTVSIFLPRDSRRVHMLVNPGQETLILKVEGSEAGAGEVTVPFEGEGEGLDILFNAQYLLEGIQRIATPKCHVQCAGTSEPALFRPTDTVQRFVYVVMPIQV